MSFDRDSTVYQNMASRGQKFPRQINHSATIEVLAHAVVALTFQPAIGEYWFPVEWNPA
ncbi:MAG: hypothetical protein LDL33_01810 [Desulfomonile sp.]|nr:hypothetical protein [Desulfomonile sp.]